MAKLKSINPNDGKELGSVKITTKLQLEDSVKKARLSLGDWSSLGLVKRGKILLKFSSLLKKNQKMLAELMTREMGKPIIESMSEVVGTAGEINYLVEEAYRVLVDEVIEPKLSQTEIKKMKKLVIEDAVDYLSKGKTKLVDVVRHNPVGVVALIKPWNFPVELPMLSMVSALIAGNTVVFKPSEYVSLLSQELMKLLYQAGVPKNVALVVYGRAQVGEMLVEANVDMVSFTGSSVVGKEIAGKCAERLIKFTLEMGGSSPAIVLKDADLEQAVNAILFGRFFNCGQVCQAVKRVLVESSVADKFTKMMVDKVAGFKVGDPMDKKTQIGPLVSDKQLKKFQKQVTQGVIQSGRILVGGRRIRTEPFVQGYFHEPTLMTYVGPKNEIMQEETFGPILPISVVNDFKQAIRQANNSSYGLTAMIFTKSKQNYLRAVKELEAGAVVVNEVGAWNVEACWTGVKDSGFGVELGKYGLLEMTQLKHIKLDLSNDKMKSYWFKIEPKVEEEA